jgi:hypothetical protein
MSLSRLQIYNGALRLLGERILGSLTENRECRRVMDDAWSNGLVDYCLEQGQWTFATRSQRIDYDPTSSPDFGYQYVFQKPNDYIQTCAVCSDDRFSNPITQYTDEAGFWYSDLQTLYVQFVSDDVNFGNNLGIWPQTFGNFVQATLAQQVAPRLTQSKEKREEIDREAKKAKLEALNKDARKNPAKFMPRGKWSRSRTGSRGIFYDPTEGR